MLGAISTASVLSLIRIGDPKPAPFLKSGLAAAKEVARYRDALHYGFNEQHRFGGLLTNTMTIAMFRILKGTESGFREPPGTALKNEGSGALVYVPPQDANAIRNLMSALERFIHVDDTESDLDPLTRMAITRQQFESILPFPRHRLVPRQLADGIRTLEIVQRRASGWRGDRPSLKFIAAVRSSIVRSTRSARLSRYVRRENRHSPSRRSASNR